MGDFATFAAKQGAVPKPPNLTGWLRDHPDITNQCWQAYRDGYAPEVIVGFFREASGIDTRWEALRKRISEIRRTA